MRRHWLPILTSTLAVLWLAGEALFQYYSAQAPASAFLPLLVANIVQMAVFGVLAALLLVTNTRPTPRDTPSRLDNLRFTAHEENLRDRRARDIPADDIGGLPYGRRAADVPIADLRRVMKHLQDEGMEAPVSEEDLDLAEELNKAGEA